MLRTNVRHFDFARFALVLFVFDVAPAEFRAGRFIESIATQMLIIFATLAPEPRGMLVRNRERRRADASRPPRRSRPPRSPGS